ncbi:hypothetical protein DFJ73DRAFT_19997 [Zopfochytrium polystomum]|nr:hypothetical protein DFJ73DRAFT_19997 [Zopfochytrium polystomum]
MRILAGCVIHIFRVTCLCEPSTERREPERHSDNERKGETESRFHDCAVSSGQKISHKCTDKGKTILRRGQ